jgi:hypothetical protein
MDNTIVPYRASTSMTVSSALDTLEARLFEAAQANVAQAGEGFTQLELHSMTIIEELKLINSMDLAAVMLRGRLIDQIEREGLWAAHPGQYGTLEEMARDQGITISELSNIRDLTRTIFPYMEGTLGIPVAQVWEQIGKSNFRELVSVLKYLISGETPGRGATADTLAHLLEDTAATAAAADLPADDASIRRMAVANLLEDGAAMTNRQLRNSLRPERTDALEPAVINAGGLKLVLMEVTDDQYLMFQRVMNNHIDVSEYDLPADPRARQREAARIPVVRRMTSLLEG